MEQTLLAAVVLLSLLVLASLWPILYQLVKQQGRMLLRLDQLEGVVATRPQAANPGTQAGSHGVGVGEPFAAFAPPISTGGQFRSRTFAAGTDTARGGIEFITDGGFEDDLNPHESGFGWRAVVGIESLSVSSDTERLRTGTRSLRPDFHGDLPALTPLISQLVLVDAHARYRLSWAVRAQEMKTAGPLTCLRFALDSLEAEEDEHLARAFAERFELLPRKSSTDIEGG